ncbi:2-iminoacetate synthase ThiH [Verrucomicrobiota bacterium]
MKFEIPDYLNPSEWLGFAESATEAQVRNAIYAENPTERELAVLLSDAAVGLLEEMAQRAQKITRRHFGRTVQLYVPLYLSSYCSGGCAYCGFASDRDAARHVLTMDEAESEMRALKELGFEELLLLTGERTSKADFDYIRGAVALAAKYFHKVTVEVFPMKEEEYAGLVEAGCTGVTLYQETYHPEQYERMHRWGPKADYNARIDAPDRLLSAGMRTVGLGTLLGLSDPVYDLVALYRHTKQLLKTHWKSGVTVSFPRIRPEAGGFEAEFPVDEKKLAQIIFAFRIVLPDVPLVLSTRESAAFRDGMTGLGANKMSANSKTTVGGYSDDVEYNEGQFSVDDDRSAEEMCRALRARGFEPVFKNWDMAYRP